MFSIFQLTNVFFIHPHPKVLAGGKPLRDDSIMHFCLMRIVAKSKPLKS